MEWNNASNEQSAAARKASSLVGLRSINDQMSKIIDGVEGFSNENAGTAQRLSNLGSISIEHAQTEHRHRHADWRGDYRDG